MRAPCPAVGRRRSLRERRPRVPARIAGEPSGPKLSAAGRLRPPQPKVTGAVASGRRPIGPGIDVLALVLLALHLVLVLRLRVVAWPEVTTPGYLWSRGLEMYRDIKREHTPGATGLLAIAFLLFGVRGFTLDLFAIAGPFAAHVAILRETRRFSPGVRMLASAFFVALFYAADGNAVWPTVLMSALAIPIASALSRGRAARAGLLLGLAILLKQTAAYALVLAAIALLVRRRPRDAAALFLGGSAPYLAALALFAAAGAGRDMLRWTLVVPFTVAVPVARFAPSLGTLAAVVLPFLPLAAEAVRERPGEFEISSRDLLLVAAGLTLICYPRFDMLQTVAGLPCLAVGAARLMNREPRRRALWARAFVATMAVSRAAVLASGGTFDGRILFWNDEPAFNALVDRLRAMPPAPVHSELWGNVLPRAERLPPGRLWVHPWFGWFFAVDRIGARIAEASARPGTILVGYRGPHSQAAAGPYEIRVVGGAPSATP